MDKKNYCLCINYMGKKIKILSGTFKEIDYFTSYFECEYAIKRRLLSKHLNNLNVYIESHRGKKYDIVYYKSRPILETKNYPIIFDKIKKIDCSRIVEYFYEKCNLDECLKSENAQNIPIVSIFNDIINNKNYINKLYNYFIADYKAFRKFILYFYNDVDLNEFCEVIPLNKKTEILDTLNICKEALIDYLKKIDIEDIEYNNEDYINDYANNIVNNELMDEEEKIKELEMLFNDSEIVNKYKGKI